MFRIGDWSANATMTPEVMAPFSARSSFQLAHQILMQHDHDILVKHHGLL